MSGLEPEKQRVLVIFRDGWIETGMSGQIVLMVES